jgi:hypothetical protein
MQLRTYHGIVILLPLFGLGVAAALHRADPDFSAGLGPGGTAHWLYPKSAVRGLLAYGMVALWLMRALRQRTPPAIEPLLWRAPLAYAAANVVVLAPLVLIQGRAVEFLSEQGGRVGLRLVIHLVIGLGYVGLMMFARERLRLSGALEDQERTVTVPPA